MVNDEAKEGLVFNG